MSTFPMRLHGASGDVGRPIDVGRTVVGRTVVGRLGLARLDLGSKPGPASHDPRGGAA
ncbi:MAG: hypothetical protein ACOYXS_08560 [Chloroflexota bacterium]